VSKHGDIWRSPDGSIELRCGDYREALADVDRVDAVITDPPYSERTHAGQRHGRMDPRYGVQDGSHLLSSRGLSYAHWSDAAMGALASWCSDRASAWVAIFHDHAARGVYERALEACGRYVFAPLACVQRGMNVRLAGDGPSNWTTWLVVSRPRKGFPKWGALPGAYVGRPHDAGENALDRSKRAVSGGKPLWLMRALVRDYSRPGDLICDPCAGGGTTLLAAAIEGRRAIGAELDPETFALAVKRLARGFTPTFPELMT